LNPTEDDVLQHPLHVNVNLRDGEIRSEKSEDERAGYAAYMVK
jgi:hypothetical protein